MNPNTALVKVAAAIAERIEEERLEDAYEVLDLIHEQAMVGLDSSPFERTTALERIVQLVNDYFAGGSPEAPAHLHTLA